MPELPEVEHAAGRLRAAVEGKRIVRATVLHRAIARGLPPARARRLVGATVERVDRRGKHQLLRLVDGSSLHVHCRMAGDWAIGTTKGPPPPHARAHFDFADGTRVTLVDPRALSVIAWHAPGSDPLPSLGPDANDPQFDVASLVEALRTRRGPIKPALLDQRVVAGVGNIYAAEALWRAKISPRAIARSISRARLVRLVDGIRAALLDAGPGAERYGNGGVDRFHVYDREGETCDRCGARIRRMVQSGRSTYYCPRCQAR